MIPPFISFIHNRNIEDRDMLITVIALLDRIDHNFLGKIPKELARNLKQ